MRGDPDVPACTELIEDMACHADLVPQVLSWEPEWMRSAPTEIGQFLWLSFYRDETLQGVLVARIYAGGDYRRGQIVQMYARDHAAATYVAMTKSCLRILRQEGVVRVRVRASAAPVQAAMQVCGFALEEQQPAYWWCNDDTDLATTAHLMFLRGDDYIRPFLPGQT